MAGGASGIDRTKSLWLRRYGSDLGDEDAREINESLVVLFRLLKKWKQRTETRPTPTEIND